MGGLAPKTEPGGGANGLWGPPGGGAWKGDLKPPTGPVPGAPTPKGEGEGGGGGVGGAAEEGEGAVFGAKGLGVGGLAKGLVLFALAPGGAE